MPFDCLWKLSTGNDGRACALSGNTSIRMMPKRGIAASFARWARRSRCAYGLLASVATGASSPRCRWGARGAARAAALNCGCFRQAGSVWARGLASAAPGPAGNRSIGHLTSPRDSWSLSAHHHSKLWWWAPVSSGVRSGAGASMRLPLRSGQGRVQPFTRQRQRDAS